MFYRNGKGTKASPLRNIARVTSESSPSLSSYSAGEFPSVISVNGPISQSQQIRSDINSSKGDIKVPDSIDIDQLVTWGASFSIEKRFPQQRTEVENAARRAA